MGKTLNGNCYVENRKEKNINYCLERRHGNIAEDRLYRDIKKALAICDWGKLLNPPMGNNYIRSVFEAETHGHWLGRESEYTVEKGSRSVHSSREEKKDCSSKIWVQFKELQRDILLRAHVCKQRQQHEATHTLGESDLRRCCCQSATILERGAAGPCGTICCSGTAHKDKLGSQR